MSHHVCIICNKEISEHTLAEAQECYYKTCLQTKEVE